MPVKVLPVFLYVRVNVGMHLHLNILDLEFFESFLIFILDIFNVLLHIHNLVSQLHILVHRTTSYWPKRSEGAKRPNVAMILFWQTVSFGICLYVCRFHDNSRTDTSIVMTVYWYVLWGPEILPIVFETH